MRDVARGRHVRWQRAGVAAWGLVTSHDSWFVVCVHAHARPRVVDDDGWMRDEWGRETTRDDAWTMDGRTMTDDRVETTDDASRFVHACMHACIHSSRDDSFIHSFIRDARARGVSIHPSMRTRASRASYFFTAHKSIDRTRATSRAPRGRRVNARLHFHSFILSFG